ncbi:MAG TPA: HAD family hydrolase [Anaerolineales bacterium]
MIRVVFFDLDGTLRQNLPSGGEFFADYAIQLGLAATSEDRLRAIRWEHFYWANSTELKADRLAYREDKLFWNAYARRQLVALGASNQQADDLASKVTEYMSQAYKPTSVVPQDVRRLLPALKDGGYRLGVLSNRDKPFQQEMEELGIAQFFELALAGGEVSMWKPEPYLFVHACERLKVLPTEAMYVGDNYFADVIGARRAGLEPVLYDPRGVFPDPDCASIQSFDELEGILHADGRTPIALG